MHGGRSIAGDLPTDGWFAPTVNAPGRPDPAPIGTTPTKKKRD